MPILSFVLESLHDLKHSIFNLNIKNINCSYYIVIIDFITDILQLCNINNSDISVFFKNPKIVFIKYLELNVTFNTAFKKINILFLFNLFQDSLLFEIQLAKSDYSYLSVMMETIKAHIYMLCEKETYISEKISRVLKVFIVK